MPITWLTNRIWLNNIQLPFLLSSILFAVYSFPKKGTREEGNIGLGHGQSNNNNVKKNILMALLSGTFLGLAIFTKLPAIIMIPMVGFLIFTANNSLNISSKNSRHSRRMTLLFRYNKNLKALGLWFIPVILIPAIWPSYAISVNQFDLWLNGVYYQTNRTTVKLSPLFDGLSDLFELIQFS